MTPPKPYLVLVVDRKTRDIVRQIGPVLGHRRAEKVERGVRVNMNINAYFTKIIRAKSADGV